MIDSVLDLKPLLKLNMQKITRNYQEKKHLGTNIKVLGKKRKLSQEELSRLAEVKYSNLVKIENGVITKPSVYTIAAIAQVLGTEIEKLLFKEYQKK